MSKTIASGKTIEEAVRNGLSVLKATEDQVTVTVLEQPSRGLFGFIGAKDAKVELELKAIESTPVHVHAHIAEPPLEAEDDDSAVFDTDEDLDDEEDDLSSSSSEEALDKAEAFIIEIAEAMGLSVEVNRVKSRDGMMLVISGSGDIGMLIGRRGQTLDALQYLTSIVANRYADHHVRLMLDAEDFRGRRRKTLEDLADRLAQRVIRTRKEVVLEPMSAQERKVIHARLQNNQKVKTYSKGEEPNRRIVILLK